MAAWFVLAISSGQILERRRARIVNAQPVNTRRGFAVTLEAQTQPEITARRTLYQAIPIACIYAAVGWQKASSAPPEG